MQDQDELYPQAVRIVRETKRATIAHVQRRLTVGYDRAARMIARMEAEGVISAQDLHGNRSVLPMVVG